ESQRTVEYHIEEQSKNRNRTVEVQGRHGEPVVKLAENVSGPQEKEVGENALEQPPAGSHQHTRNDGEQCDLEHNPKFRPGAGGDIDRQCSRKLQGCFDSVSGKEGADQTIERPDEILYARLYWCGVRGPERQRKCENRAKRDTDAGRPKVRMTPGPKNCQRRIVAIAEVDIPPRQRGRSDADLDASSDNAAA